MNNKLILVYGSLRQGMGNHGLLADSEFLGEYNFEDNYVMLDWGGFPALTPSEEIYPIVGEVYKVDEATYRRVEMLEGYPNFYDRIEVNTPYGKAGMYFVHNSHRTNDSIVEDGNWVKRVEKRNKERADLEKHYYID